MDVAMMDAPVVISSVEASAQGRRTYFTGKPCKHGHIDERYVRNATCVRCMRDHSIAFNESNRKTPKAPGPKAPKSAKPSKTYLATASTYHLRKLPPHSNMFGFSPEPAEWNDDG